MHRSSLVGSVSSICYCNFSNIPLNAVASVRDRALILLLLRAGIKIGELLEVKLNDIGVPDRKILIYLGANNYQGRGFEVFMNSIRLLLPTGRRRTTNAWLQGTIQRLLFYGLMTVTFKSILTVLLPRATICAAC